MGGRGGGAGSDYTPQGLEDGEFTEKFVVSIENI